MFHGGWKPQATAVSSSQLYDPFSVFTSALFLHRLICIYVPRRAITGVWLWRFFTVKRLEIISKVAQMQCLVWNILSNIPDIWLPSFWINSLCILNALNRNELASELMYVHWLCFQITQAWYWNKICCIWHGESLDVPDSTRLPEHGSITHLHTHLGVHTAYADLWPNKTFIRCRNT